MNDKISIIIPIYNVEKYIEKCIESILAQEYTEIEIILVDDGSEDQSGRICDEFAMKDKRIRVIHKENGGSNSARLAGVKKATGQYVCFVDGDDWVEPQMIKNMASAITSEEIDIVASGMHVDYPDRTWTWKNGMPEGVYSEGRLRQFYSRMIFSEIDTHGIVLGMVGKIYKKDLLLRNLESISLELYFGEDAACVFLCCLEAKNIILQDGCWYHYVQREESVSTSRDEKIFKNNCLFYNTLYERFSKSKEKNALISQLRRYMLVLNNKALADTFQIHYEKIPWEFPFEMFPAESRIVIYGAGKIGKAYVRQISHSSYCDLVLWIDKNVTEAGVKKPVELLEYEYDYILVAIKNPDIVQEVRHELKQLGVWESKIVWKMPVKGSEKMYTMVELDNKK